MRTARADGFDRHAGQRCSRRIGDHTLDGDGLLLRKYRRCKKKKNCKRPKTFHLRLLIGLSFWVRANGRRRLYSYSYGTVNNPSQGDVAMLLRRILVAFVAQHGEGGDHFPAGEARLDDLVDVSPLGGDIRIGELLLVLGDLLFAIVRAAIENVHRP